MDQNNEDKGIDLSGALDNASSRVKFGGNESVVYSDDLGTPKIIRWVMKYSGGYIKNEKQASYIILGFVVLTMVISLFLIFDGGEEKLTPEEQRFLDIPSEAI